MTDDRGEPGRIDLRSLDGDAVQMERVIASVMDRIEATPQDPRDRVLEFAERSAGPVRIVAVLLAAAAVFVILFTERGGASEPRAVSVVASWVESQHVPSNGELLMAFQGYRR